MKTIYRYQLHYKDGSIEQVENDIPPKDFTPKGVVFMILIGSYESD